MTTRTYSEILRAAADRIERDGWYQGAYHPPIPDEEYDALGGGPEPAIRAHNLPCCASGAIRAELPLDLEYQWEVLQRFVDESLPDYGSIPGWNDVPGRTQEEVVAALRAAADLAEQS